MLQLICQRQPLNRASLHELPPIIYGLSIEHLHVPGTLTLMPETLIHILTDIGESLLRLGVHSMVLVNGHGGNDSCIHLAGHRQGMVCVLDV